MKILSGKLKYLLFAITMVIFTAMSFPEIVDYLKTGNQLEFNKDKYMLSWSSHPSANYYKQEYLKSGEQLSGYHNMLLIEAIDDEMKISEVLKTKVNELELRKKWDYVANYQVFENEEIKTEGIIDFVVSDTMYIYEWNLYRYQVQKGSDNKNRMVLFAYSYRDSLNDDNDLKKFFGHIKETRMDMINKLSSYNIPKITLPPQK